MKPDGGPLAVSIRDLPVVHVASIDCRLDVGPGLLDSEIRACFLRLRAWVEGLGYDPLAWPSIGVLTMAEGHLSGYACCIRIPTVVQNGSAEFQVGELVGGKYAVLSMAKDPATIGEAIRRFYESYVAQHNLGLDGTRPTYEIYYETTMEYCAPIL